MRTKITLILLFLNVVLFAFIFYIEPHFQTEDSFNQAGGRVLGPEASNIVALEISARSPAQKIELKKDHDSWLLSQPPGWWPANLDAVHRILTELQTLRHETSFLVSDLARSGQTLADYGLDQPQLTLTFTAGGENAQADKTYTLAIGANTAVGNNLYVLSPDRQRIHVVGRSLADSLTLPPDQLRDDRLFTIPVFEASALNVQTAGPPVRIQRAGDNWSFINPLIARASKAMTELAINDLDSLRVQSFVSARDADDRTGLDNPALRITLDGNNRRETLLLGSPVPSPASAAPADQPETSFFAKMEDKVPVFVVSFPNDLLTRLKDAQGRLRETHFLEFDPPDVTAITLRAPNYPDLVLQRLESATTARDNAVWQIVSRSAAGPQTQPADSVVIQHLLENLSFLAAKKFVSDAPAAADLENWGFNRPEREIVLTLASGGAPAAVPNAGHSTLTLQLGLGTDAQVYARVSGAYSVYAVDPAILAATPVTPLAYRDRLLQELPAGAQIAGLKLTRLVDKTVLYEKAMAAPADNAAAFWAATLAAETPDRRRGVNDLLKSLSNLHAKNFVLDAFPPSVTVAGENRPWSYELDATIALAAAGSAPATTETMQLFFTERVGGATQLAGSPKLGVVFEAEQPLLDAVFTLAPPPPIAAPPPAATPGASPPSPK